MCEHCQSWLRTVSRRGVMAGAAALLASSALPFSNSRADQPVSSKPAPNAIPAAEALDRLMQGNVRYATNDPLEKDFTRHSPDELWNGVDDSRRRGSS